MAKIKINSNLLSRAKRVAEISGYSGVVEFIEHIMEKEISKHEADEVDEKVSDRLRGLGYIE
jgi:hypothetical protein